MKNNIIPQGNKLHPATAIALLYLSNCSAKELDKWKRIFKNKYTNNETANRCGKTLEKLFEPHTPINEADILALAWIMRFNVYAKKDSGQ